MKPVDFEEANMVMKAPAGEEDEVNDLMVQKTEESFISVWELSEKEIKGIVSNGKVILYVYGSAHPPVSLEVYGVDYSDDKVSGNGKV